MITYEVGLVVEVATAQKAAAVRDKVAAYIANEPDVDLLSWSAARVSQRWEVFVVEVDTRNTWSEVVEADDEAGARARFTAANLVIANVVALR